MRINPANAGRGTLAAGLALATGTGLVAAALTGGVAPALAKASTPHDLAVKMKVADVTTLGPLARITVKNRGTSDETGVQVSLHEGSAEGPMIWSDTVDLPHGKTAKFSPRVYPDPEERLLVLRVDPAVGDDGNESDNESHVGLWLKGRAGQMLAGRELHRNQCAECHGESGEGGTGPSLARAKARAIFVAAHADEGGAHGFPWLSKTDAKVMGKFYKSPDAVVEPPEPPTPPEGGWPGFAAEVGPLFQEKCSNCHTSLARAGVGLGSYAGASKNARKALGAVKRGSMPPGKGNLAREKVELIENWILGGKRP